MRTALARSSHPARPPSRSQPSILFCWSPLEVSLLMRHRSHLGSQAAKVRARCRADRSRRFTPLPGSTGAAAPATTMLSGALAAFSATTAVRICLPAQLLFRPCYHRTRKLTGVRFLLSSRGFPKSGVGTPSCRSSSTPVCRQLPGSASGHDLTERYRQDPQG